MELYKDRDWLYQKYVVEKMSGHEIGRLLGISKTTILNKLKEYDIKIRSLSKSKTNYFEQNCKIELYHNKDWLHKKYIIEKISMKNIGKICKISNTTIGYWLVKFNIEKCPRGESRHLAHVKKVGNQNYCDKKFLQKKYIEERLSTEQIAKFCGVSPTTIRRWLKIYNIPIRDLSECRISIDIPDKEWLERKYIGENLSLIKIAKLCKTSSKTIRNWLIRYKINIRSGFFPKGNKPWNTGLTKDIDKRIMDLMGGANNINWKGGTTNLQEKIRKTPKYKKWRTDIHKRDNYICRDCHERKRYIFVHHSKSFSRILHENNITMVKQALECGELWNLDNGKTVCYDCHQNLHDNIQLNGNEEMIKNEIYRPVVYKEYKDRDKLYDMYWNQKLSTSQINEKLGTHAPINKWLRKFNIPIRTRSEALQIRYGEKEYRDKVWLNNKYWNEKLSTVEIGKLCKVRTCLIYFWLKKLNIPIRSLKEGINSSIRRKMGHKKYYDKKWLENKYLKELLPMSKIAKECNTTISTIKRFLEKYGIKQRTISEQMKLRYKDYIPIRIDKICEYCGTPFKVNSTSKNQRFCTREHGNLSRRIKIKYDKICEYCGKKYKPKHHNLKHYLMHQKYHSRECMGLARKNRIKKACAYEPCGKIFEVKPSQKNQKYHSNKCKYLAKTKVINKDWLYQKYIIEGLTAVQISKLCNTSSYTINRRLKKYNIPIHIYQHNVYKEYWDKDWLYQKYVVEKISAVKIGEMFGIGPSGVYIFLKKFNIPIRSVGEGINNYFVDANKEKLYCDKEWLKGKYTDEGMGLREIGKLCNVGEVTILFWMKKYKIPRRDRIEAINAFNIKKRGNNRYCNKEYLINKYYNEELSAEEVGKLCNTHHSIIYYWLRKCNIPIRPGKEAGIKLKKII